MKKVTASIIVLLLLSVGNMFAQPAIEWDTKDPQSYFKLGEGMEQMGELEAALEAYVKATELDPTFMEAHLKQGKILSRLKRNDEAQKVFNMLLKNKHSDNDIKSAAYTGIGLIHFKNKEYDKAVKQLIKATKLADDHAPTWYFLGQCYEKNDELEKSADAYRKAVDLAPDNLRYDKALSRVLDAMLW